MAWTLGVSPSFPPRVSDRSTVRSFWQRGWDWFDDLSDLQTVCCLGSALLGLTVAALLLLLAASGPSIGSAARAPQAVASATSVSRSVVQAAPATPVAPAWTRAQTVALGGVNLRARPTTSSATLATLPPATEVFLVGETAVGEAGTWQHVRTVDGLDGWIIDSALE